MTRHPAARMLLPLLASAVLAGLAPAAWACYAGYRTLDFQVAESPLILVGRVLDVRPDPSLSTRESGHREDKKPTVAYVRVVRVLKGRWADSNILIGSGPIASCSPDEEYMTFRPGRTHVFILPELPRTGKAALQFWGSLLDEEDTERVEARLNRARQFRAAHLESVRRSLPETLEAAQVLFGKLREAGATWPREADHVLWFALSDEEAREHIANSSSEEERERWMKLHGEKGPPRPAAGTAEDSAIRAMKEVRNRIANLSCEILETAMALDWMNEDSTSWSRHVIWTFAVKEWMRAHEAEVARFRRDRIAGILRRAGVGDGDVAAYLAAVRDGDFPQALDFPPEAPHPREKKSGPVLTTEFILLYTCFDQGWIYPAYSMDREQLAFLDPVRLREIIPVMYGSREYGLKHSARVAIRRMPGLHFADLVMRDVVGRDPKAWSHLWDDQPQEAAEERIRGMVRSARTELTPWGFACLWKNLADGKCFEDVAVGEALSTLHPLEIAAAGKTLEQDDEQLFRNLHAYLRAAFLDRGGPADEAGLTAEQYETWFKAHPRAPSPEK